MSEPLPVEIEGRTVRLTNLDKVLYPSGFTKAEVIDYMARIAPVAVPHLRDRALTFRRFPNGTDRPGFFEKRCPSHRPDWIDTALGPGDGETIAYCCLDGTAAMVWAANLAAIELHAPMALATDLANPRAVVFDLDPGAPATIVECCAVALEIQQLLDGLGLVGFAKTSGSKGLQIYVPLNHGAATHEECGRFALAVGQVLQRRFPDRVVTSMAKAERAGKVLIDWSQNSFHKTTIAPYSLRARPTPTVSTPVDWDEVAAGARNEAVLQFEAAQVIERVADHGDLFEPVLSLEQHLPQPTAANDG